ncbi:DNA-processing protein DprA [Desulfurivibrio alkaliphilus]|uniref:DNA protecting protein DprA n=1 Tax=Desulfurivibrio alkaliphilus (strain DSM 19089 / UNIQEM U267 / AHT2) TaxID=589865 RepID=D6Z6Z7_DESAT|nr:DNA-processing protein DprA [Desulfurivibrio alkaliphilus]ADH86984.1 DNA protecting protein DprA [Desulfurivibrio alkaliphilus AHT 2]
MTTTEPDIPLLRWLTLAHTPGLGPAGANRLLEATGSIEQLFAASPNELQALGLRPAIAQALIKRDGLAAARRELAAARHAGLHCLPRDHPLYPALLNETSDPPLILYGHGDPNALAQPALALVGARAASVYGLKMAARLAGELAAAGFTVVSGGALGIDSAAHQGALDTPGGRTVAVLGCGLDVVYPPQNKKLFAKIAATGMLLSEYPPGTRPEPFRFPARNRIISGMSAGTAVIEAARRSGSLITAEMAMELGREVFAVPGRADSNKSEGCHRLIKEGAKLVHGVEDILEELGTSRPAQPAAGAATAPGGRQGAGSDLLAGPPLTNEAATVLAVLDDYPKAIEEIITQAGMAARQVNAVLLELELQGLIESEPGPQYRKT